MAEEQKREATTFIVESKTGGSPRLIQAKSAPAVMRALALETWNEPRPARTSDFVNAFKGGAKVEQA
jgi:hypothetical protein